MKKRLPIIISLFIVATIVALLPKTKKGYIVSTRQVEIKGVVNGLQKNEGKEDKTNNPQARREFEFNQLKDPKTGVIPSGIRQKELAFARENLMPETINASPRFQRAQASGSQATNEATFVSFGPVHLGGRTRALDIDIANEDIILAGSVSGGVWRSTDQGASWTRTNSLDLNPSVTDFVQDRRTGKTNIWYYSTGEFENSAALNSDTYYGNGIYKSEDNGVTWSQITSTALDGFDNTQGVATESDFTLVDQLNIDYSNPNGTEIYAAAMGMIIRSEDGFETYNIVLGSNDNENWTDLAITSTGKVFAVISNLLPSGTSTDQGLFESEDGINWTKVDFPATFPTTYERIEMAIDPQNENRLYIVSVTQEDLEGGVNEGNLMMYDDATDTWTDLTDNMGLGTDFFNSHYTQSGYDLFIAVHPEDDQTIFIGGVNLFRSTDGFTTNDNRTRIGGYNTLNQLPFYENQHPDQHSIAFFPSDGNKMLVGTDGGVHLTTDNLAPPSTNTVEPVKWQALNNGYITTQFYHAAMQRYDRLDNQIVGGLQDNSTYVKFTEDTDEEWTFIIGGDGAFTGITYNSLVGSTQLSGTLGRFELVGNQYENPVDITPSTNSADFLFANPWAYNPVAQDQYFVASRGKVYFTNDVRETPGEGEWDEIRGGSLPGNVRVSSFGLSHQPEGVLYFGTRNGSIFKINDVRTLEDGDSPEILDTSDLPAGNVAAIAVDPRDADNVIVTISNYNVRSVWQTLDGGVTWASISGNLEENPDGTGNGPAVRVVAIMPDDAGGNYYFVGTSVGLFMTQALDGDNTVWVQQSTDVIGQAVISWIETRPIDGTALVATHGNGVFKARYDVGLFPHLNYSIDPQTEQIELRANLTFDASTLFAYQWIKDDEIVPNANGDTFTTNLTGSYRVRVILQDGTTGESNTIEYEGDDITSIDDNLLRKVEQIVVDANPSNGVFNLAFPADYVGDFELAVVGADGQQKVASSIKGYAEGEQVPVDLSNLPDGLYILNVANQQSNASIKLLKRTN
ncbi:hypothetical protein [Roseivirga sp. E12]|uniref:hypothetical protein n=1 Tax=Roseivirga sp. E12 TaxID=2819237 RepID=UPI001ABC5822|nr:hypothetical protein [Roseivirga sp. E12]MBO3699216.1 hypothetical protein [Roseivirga sp. E12]